MFEHPAAAKFRQHVLDGDWDKVITTGLLLVTLSSVYDHTCTDYVCCTVYSGIICR